MILINDKLIKSWIPQIIVAVICVCFISFNSVKELRFCSKNKVMASKFLLIKDGTYHESVIDRYHMQEVFNVGFYTMKGNSILFYPYDYRQKIDSSRVFQGDMRGRKLTLKYQNANEEVLKECWCKHYDKLSSLSTQLNSPTKIE